MPVAMADDATVAKELTDYTDIQGVIVGKNFENREIRASLIESQEKMGELAQKFIAQEEGFKNFTYRLNYTNGFIEEFYDGQRCDR